MLAKLMIFRLKEGIEGFFSQYRAKAVAMTRLAVVLRRMTRSVSAIEMSIVGPALWMPAQLIRIDGS